MEEEGGLQKFPVTPIFNYFECDAEFCYFHSNAHVGSTCE
jgi:hypothetical protein